QVGEHRGWDEGSLTGPSGDEPGAVGGGLVDDLADAAPLLVVDDRPDRDLLRGGIAHRQVPGQAGQLLDLVVGDRIVDEVAGAGPGAVGGGLVDELAHAAPLLVVDDRPARDLLGGGIAHRQVPGTAGQLLDVVVGDRFVDEVAAGGHADLSLVHPRTEGAGRGGRTDLGTGQDDERIVAAELQVAALEEATGGLADLAAGRGRPGEGDDGDLGGGDDGLTGVEPTGQDLEEP